MIDDPYNSFYGLLDDLELAEIVARKAVDTNRSSGIAEIQPAIFTEIRRIRANHMAHYNALRADILKNA